MVEVATPSAATSIGLETTVLWLALTAPGVKLTGAVPMTSEAPGVSGAWNVSMRTGVDLTVKVTTPLEPVTPDAGLMAGLPGPALLVNATVLPPTGWLSASLRVTVMVDVVVPSAGTDVGTAAT